MKTPPHATHESTQRRTISLLNTPILQTGKRSSQEANSPPRSPAVRTEGGHEARAPALCRGPVLRAPVALQHCPCPPGPTSEGSLPPPWKTQPTRPPCEVSLPARPAFPASETPASRPGLQDRVGPAAVSPRLGWLCDYWSGDGRLHVQPQKYPLHTDTSFINVAHISSV